MSRDPLTQLQTELRLHDRALASSSCGITIADAADPDLPLIYVNDAFEKITGYPPAEVIGRNCRFLQRDDRDQPGLIDLRGALHAGQDSTDCPAQLSPRRFAVLERIVHLARHRRERQS